MKCEECNIRKGCLIHDPERCIMGKLFPPEEFDKTVRFEKNKIVDVTNNINRNKDEKQIEVQTAEI